MAACVNDFVLFVVIAVEFHINYINYFIVQDLKNLYFNLIEPSAYKMPAMTKNYTNDNTKSPMRC